MTTFTQKVKKILFGDPEKQQMANIAQIHDDFSIDTNNSTILILHKGAAIAEFQPEATQKQILDTLEQFRCLAANNYQDK